MDDLFDEVRRRKQLGGSRMSVEQIALANLTIEYFRFAPIAERVWELRFNLTAHDAFYVALAEALDSPLVTLDKRLVFAPGPLCEFLVPETS